MAAVASSGGLTSLWFMTRGTGVVSLVLLTLVVAVGVANVRRVQLEGVPRFVVEAIHRNAALLAVAFLCVHIVMAVLDPFAPIKLTDAVIPFISAYRPIWLGLGAVAFDLLIAVVITSIWRRRVGFGAWRWIHWAAYLCWPIAIVHGLGTGTDAKTKWMLLLTAGCVVIVVVAAFARALSGWPDHVTPRLTGMLASVAVPIGLLIWLPNGPLAKGWAKRAGTPTTVVATGAGPAATSSASSKGGGSSPPAGAPAAGSFQAPVQGSVRQAAGDDGNASIHMVLSIGAGQVLSQLHILIEGRPLQGGGVEMRASSVTLGSADDPHRYRGAITALSGTTIAATVRDVTGRTFAIVAALRIDPSSQTASGTVTATAGG
jgi:methionine sulfoxide reductase heme-binding subunit